MSTTAPSFAVYVRSDSKPRRWRLHDVYGSHAEAMTAAIALNVPAVWVTAIEASHTTSTELTPAAMKQRPATAGAS